MDKVLKDHLSPREKTLVAMGAAMTGGCRKCADKLHGIALSLGIPESEMLKAFRAGLDARSKASVTMREKVSSLLGAGLPAITELEEDSGILSSLIRIASFAAANSAPDVVEEIIRGREQGVTPEQVEVCIALGKMVRKNAIAFSDQEILEQAGVSDSEKAEPCCPVSPGSNNACSCG